MLNLQCLAKSSKRGLSKDLVYFQNKIKAKHAFQAAFDGTNEVWGAVLASTVTTVAVFLPVLFIEEEAGQSLVVPHHQVTESNQLISQSHLLAEFDIHDIGYQAAYATDLFH